MCIARISSVPIIARKRSISCLLCSGGVGGPAGPAGPALAEALFDGVMNINIE